MSKNFFFENVVMFWLGYHSFQIGVMDPPWKVKKHFYLVREWQRGYNRAYFDNQNAVQT